MLCGIRHHRVQFDIQRGILSTSSERAGSSVTLKHETFGLSGVDPRPYRGEFIIISLGW